MLVIFRYGLTHHLEHILTQVLHSLLHHLHLVDIFNPNVEEITDDEAQDVVSNLDYEFQNYKDYEMQTEICGIND